MLDKLCPKCKQTKPEFNFGFKDKATGKLHSVCKVCSREYTRRHYANNKQYYIDKTARLKRTNAHWLASLKATLCCKVCGEDHPATLDFHHENDETKEIDVSLAIARGWNESRIRSEIAKCVVLCYRCHRIHHYNLKHEIDGLV